MAEQAIWTGLMPAEPWPDMPIEPSWIREGNPVACGVIVAQSPDKRVSSGFWSCSPGEFNWQFTWDEFVHVLDGKVTITQNGRTHTLAAGDVAHFPLGAQTVWRVVRPVRKFFVIRTPEPFQL